MIVAEIDESWRSVLEGLKESYPSQVLYPQDNWYGLAIISRLPILKSELLFLVQNDVPSIDAIIELPSGDQVRLIAVHPRPPEPIRGNDAVARDAELAMWGKELRDYERPTVIGGDLNDVAWSDTTRLFLRLSGMLDPRRGRGLFNTFHATHPWMRFPLDHVFHSRHFAIRSVQRLQYVGSDHFPIFIDLQLEPRQIGEQEPLEEDQGDKGEAKELIERATNTLDA
jgi:endonuclease/exonuclease/phosphatase (EEP) superfamily protein YafD